MTYTYLEVDGETIRLSIDSNDRIVAIEFDGQPVDMDDMRKTAEQFRLESN